VSQIRHRLSGYGEVEWENAYDKILDTLMKKKRITVEYGEAGLKSFLRTVTTNRCADERRKLNKRKERHDQVIEGDYDAPRMTTFELPQLSRYGGKKPKHRFRTDSATLLDMAISRGITVCSMDIFEDYCSGDKRKAVAEKYNLSDNQVKWRLAYTRKRLKDEIERHERKESLRISLG